MFRSSFLSAVAVLACVSTAQAEPIQLTDIAGRTVTLEKPATRVLLGEGRQLIALSLVHPEPGNILVGWLGDFRRLDPASYELYKKTYPNLDSVPMIGVTSENTISMEKALATKPDVAILSGGHGPSPKSVEKVRQLEAAGIPVVFIDFRSQPLENTIPSIEILGKVLGQEERANAFVAYYRRHLDAIAARLKEAAPAQPKVLMTMRPGPERACCGSPGKGNLGDYIEFAGGKNIGADVLPGPLGPLNPEYVISQQPDVFIATGGSSSGAASLVIGAGVDEATSKSTLAKTVETPVFKTLPAVKTGRVHGLWHNFYNTPMNILAVEAMAKWFHPELFADLDPAATMREINEQFLAVPFQGVYWVSLD